MAGGLKFDSTIGTVGLAVGITAAQAPAGVLWTQIFGMFFGRLEFFAVIVETAKRVSDMRMAMAANKENGRE